MNSKSVESDVWRVKINPDFVLLNDKKDWADKQWGMIQTIYKEMRILSDPRNYKPKFSQWHVNIENYSYDGMSCTNCCKSGIKNDYRNIRFIYMLEIGGELVPEWYKIENEFGILKIVACGDCQKIKDTEYGKEGWIRLCK